ncbi:hypothetical protein, partial [Halobacillus sp. BBL2006]|uniref:hypothetical protein n=1 Tax=Halobacillus sp. BBL2006 TaxID=1543706 RepID=UPI00054322EA
LVLFLLMINIVMVFRVDNLMDTLYAFKEVSLIFFIVMSFFYFKNIIINNFIKYLRLIIFLNILNLIVGIITLYIGPEVYAKLIVGHSFYGNSEIGNFRISHIGGLFRTPALLGSSAAYGYFGLFSFFIFRYFKKQTSSLFALGNVALSFTRSVYIALLFYFLLVILYKVYKKEVTSKHLVITCTVIFVMLIGGISKLNYLNSLSGVNSIFSRLNNWSLILDQTDFNFFNFLFGGFYGFVGLANDTSIEFLKIFDNSWLFYMYNIGITGVIMTIVYLVSFIKRSKMSIYIILPLAISMFFINLTQSQVFLIFFPLVLILYCSTKERMNFASVSMEGMNENENRP